MYLNNNANLAASQNQKSVIYSSTELDISEGAHPYNNSTNILATNMSVQYEDDDDSDGEIQAFDWNITSQQLSERRQRQKNVMQNE